MSICLLLFVALAVCTGRLTQGLTITHCVQPSNSHVECKNGSSNAYLCEELQFYLTNISRYFTSNTTLEFLPGEHLITGVNATITDAVMNLKLTGESKACLSNSSFHKPPQIICSGEAGLVFQKVINLTLSYLSFGQCGQFVPYRLYGHDDGIPKASLAFDTVTNLTLQSLIVHNGSGYGLLLYNTRESLTVRNCVLLHNHGSVNYLGGNALVNYIGTGCFANDSDEWPGAEVEIVNSTFLFGRYDAEYENGTLATGLAITLSCSNVNVSVENVTAQGNQNSMNITKGFGGNVYIHYFNSWHLISNQVIISNSHFLDGNSWIGAGVGVSLFIGAVYKQGVPSRGMHNQTSCENRLLVKNSIFKTNKAFTGSGLYVNNVQHLLNNNCTAHITLSNCTFSHNFIKIRKNPKRISNAGIMTFLAAKLSGVTTPSFHTYTILIDGVTLEYNKMIVQNYRRIVWGSSALYVKGFLDIFQTRNCTFQHNSITAILAYHSYLTFTGNITIYNNTGANGGGILLCSSSNVIFTPNTNMLIANNHALHSGGGIFVEDSCPGSSPLCFYQIEGANGCGKFGNMTKLVADCNINVAMINNTADYAGSQVFGGNVGNCYIHQLSFVPGHRTFLNIFHPQGPSTDLSSIASDPKTICFCRNSTTVDCGDDTWWYPRIFPGENVTVHVVIVGQLNGTVPGQLQVNISDNQYISFNTHTRCTGVTFTAYARTKMTATYAFEIFAQLDSSNASFALSPSKYLRVNFKDCPKGYILNEAGTCDCNANWKNIRCDFMKLTLTRTSPAWLGFMDGKTVYQTVCPNDYCTDRTVLLKVANGTFDPDEQCAPHHTGILCGACKENYSLSGSSSDCVNCTKHPSTYLSLYICGQLFCGLALIVLLTFTNWTITNGTLAGLLFYANIFKLNLFMFLPRKFNGITIIILALNMDFHTSKCLYDGLDAYSKAWLAFAFPVYLWILIAAIIYLSRYFDCVAKLFGRNGAKILATLIEFSYAGLTQAVVVSLSPVRVDVINPHTNQTERYSLRWVYDPNIAYLETKHFLLFVTGIVFGLLILAYTLVLLFIQPLQRFSHLRCFSWVAKLKPLTDAYTSPHIIKKKCQFWPGLLLFVRLVLIVIFAFNTRMDKSTNSVAIMSGCLLLVIVGWSMGGIYTRAYLNVLNALFILNLAILVLLVNSYEIRHLNFAYMSASLTILIACTVLLLHVLLRLKKLINSRGCCERKIRFLRNPLDLAGRRDPGSTEDSSLLSHVRD